MEKVTVDIKDFLILFNYETDEQMKELLERIEKRRGVSEKQI
jgi:hypothetical protein